MQNEAILITWWIQLCSRGEALSASQFMSSEATLSIQSLGRAAAHDKCFPWHCKEITVQKAGRELTGQLIQQVVHSLQVSNGLLGKMAIRSVFRSINENSTESLKSKYLLLTSMICFAIKSSFGYDTQVYNKINKHALKDREKGITPGN